MRLLLLAMLVVSVEACSGGSSHCLARIDATQLRSLRLDNAGSDALRAAETGDFRFIGVYGFTAEVPGMEEKGGLVKKYGVRMIQGTSDAPCDEEHAQLDARAREYARAYNLELLGELKRPEGR